MKYNIGNYSINQENGITTIDYRRSIKDLYYIIAYFLVSLAIFFLVSKIFQMLLSKNISAKVIACYVFGSILFLFGLYFFSVSFETLIKPTKKVFLIDGFKKQLQIRKSLFVKYRFGFHEISGIETGSRNIKFTNRIRYKTYKRKLRLIELFLHLKDGSRIKIHQFEPPNLYSGYDQKRNNKILRENSHSIVELISKECGISFKSLGTKKSQID